MAQSLFITFATKKVRVAKAVVAGVFSSSLRKFLADGSLGAAVASVSDTPSLTFPIVENGDYQITHSRLTADGDLIGDSIVDILSITDGAVSIDQLVDGIASVSYDILPFASESAATV